MEFDTITTEPSGISSTIVRATDALATRCSSHPWSIAALAAESATGPRLEPGRSLADAVAAGVPQVFDRQRQVIGEGEARVVPVAGVVDGDHPVGPVALHPEAHRLRGGGPADPQYDLRDHRRRELGVGEEVRGGGDDDRTVDRRPSPELGQRFGDHRPRHRPGEPQDRLGLAMLGLEPDPVGRPDDDDTTLHALEVGQRRRRRRLGLDRGCRNDLVHRHSPDGLERLAQGPVEVDRPAVGAGGGLDRAHRRDAGLRWRPVARHRQIGRPAGGCAVEADLIDGLPSTPVAELGRPIGGAHDHRHARVVGLDHGRQVVGRRGAGGAHEHRRTTGRTGDAEREEAGRAFVELDPRAQRGLGVQGDRQRGRAGARADHHLTDTPPRQLGGERGDALVGRIVHQPSMTSSRALSFTPVSASSSSGTESATIPAPENRWTPSASTSADRNATRNSRCPRGRTTRRERRTSPGRTPRGSRIPVERRDRSACRPRRAWDGARRPPGSRPCR